MSVLAGGDWWLRTGVATIACTPGGLVMITAASLFSAL
jgi:hypothetical protein